MKKIEDALWWSWTSGNSKSFALVTARAEVLYYVPGLHTRIPLRLFGERSMPALRKPFAPLTGKVPRNARIAVIPEGSLRPGAIPGSGRMLAVR